MKKPWRDRRSQNTAEQQQNEGPGSPAVGEVGGSGDNGEGLTSEKSFHSVGKGWNSGAA